MRSHAVILAALFAVACGDDGGGMSGASSTVAPTETTEASGENSSGTGGTSDGFRRFGEFHVSSVAVGDKNEDETNLVGWSNLVIREDGTLTRRGFACTSPVTNEYGWEPIEAGAIRVVAADIKPSGEFDWGFDSVAEVTISAGAECDEISVTVRYLDPERPIWKGTYVAGGLCPGGEGCFYELVWCDGEAPEPCTG